MDEYRKEAQEIIDESVWTFKKVLPKLIILFVILGIVGFGFKLLSQPGRIIQKTMDADNVIYNYEWFHQAYQDITATELKITNAQNAATLFNENAGDRKDWTFEDKNESSRLGSVVLGLQNHREQLVADYNAKSKMINRNIFKGKSLPHTLQ
tara:strand:+ start:1725 stop:2180 length:456 start_codon:yes stop_codon:yes gene_type:complete